MPHSPKPPAVTAPGCVEGRRRHRGRSHGSHVNCPPAAACRATPSHGCNGIDTAGPLRTTPPPLEPSVRRALSRLYDRLKDSDKALSAADLLLFMEEEQKESLKPGLKEIPSDRTYSFTEFCDFWYEHASHSKRPIDLEKQKAEFDKPISNYYINSSHNTYIGDGDQVRGFITPDQYRKVIRRGCRCVEIDVWNSPRYNDTARSSRRGHRGSTGQHWSLDHLLSWMKDKCGLAADSHEGRWQLERTWALTNKDWADKLEHEPRVCHALPTIIAGDLSARTGLPFRLVCRAVREVAFEQTDLPLIISLEDHTTDDQHKKMIEIMVDEWAGLLLDDPIPGCDPEKQQPRVMDLKRKILIKGRRKPQKCAPSKPDLERKAPSTPSNPSISGSSLKAKISQLSAMDYYRTARQPAPPPEEKQVKNDRIQKTLDKLAVYTYSAGPFKSFNSKDSDKPAHIFSFSEEKLKALHRTKHKDVFQHNKKYLARTFPAGAVAFLSTNPNLPTLFWRKGVQMVSLNWQSWDTAMHLNDAMFDDTQGWVLKPPGYQSDSSATCQAHVAGKKRIDLRITILAGQNIPMPRAVSVDGSSGKRSRSVSSTTVNGDSDARAAPATPNMHDNDFRPKVKCYLHVESHGERNQIKKMGEDEICLETKPAETQHPTWHADEAQLQFPVVNHVVEELSFLRFRVENTGFMRIRDQGTAWACIRLDRLQEGYRLINLKDHNGDPTDGTLLVKIEKTILPRPLSLRAKTWNACKKGGEEVTRLGSRWSCFGQGAT